jgi:hypothetical protein
MGLCVSDIIFKLFFLQIDQEAMSVLIVLIF